MRKSDKKFSNLSELTRKIITDLDGFDQPVWFRGQASKSWTLIPSILRKTYSPEMTLIKKFKQNATMLINPPPNNLIDWLFIMQHHGAPTRLLDWTESPLIAAYFAADEVTNENDDKDGSIWALLPVELNKKANLDPAYPFDIPSFAEDRVLNNYSPETFANEATSILSPVAVIAPRNSARMQVQLSVFTINHKNNDPIENIGDKNHIWRYILPSGCKTKIKSELRSIGFGKYQLFPELQSIGDLLKEET